MSSYTLASYEPQWANSYAEFVARNYSKTAYQGRQEYINWLYIDNPSRAGFNDFLILLKDKSEVVGCFHRLRFSFRDTADNKTYVGAAIHNLMVDEAHRHGIGFLLIREVFAKEPLFIVPGTKDALAKMYRRLGSADLPSQWGQRTLVPRPVALARRLARQELSQAEVEAAFAQTRPGQVELSTKCSPRFVERVNVASVRIKLSDEFLDWRLFDKRRVRTIVLCDPQSDAFLLLVVGTRKGVPVGRVIYTYFPAVGCGLRLTDAALKLSAGLGCVVFLSISSDECFAEVAKSLKIGTKTTKPNTLLHSKVYRPDEFRLWPLLSDYGFEEYFGRGGV